MYQASGQEGDKGRGTPPPGVGGSEGREERRKEERKKGSKEDFKILRFEEGSTHPDPMGRQSLNNCFSYAVECFMIGSVSN